MSNGLRKVDRIFMVLTVSGGTFAKVSQALAHLRSETGEALL